MTLSASFKKFKMELHSAYNHADYLTPNTSVFMARNVVSLNLNLC